MDKKIIGSNLCVLLGVKTFIFLPFHGRKALYKYMNNNASQEWLNDLRTLSRFVHHDAIHHRTAFRSNSSDFSFSLRDRKRSDALSEIRDQDYEETSDSSSFVCIFFKHYPNLFIFPFYQLQEELSALIHSLKNATPDTIDELSQTLYHTLASGLR